MNTSTRDLSADGAPSIVLQGRIALAEERYERAVQRIASIEQRFAAIQHENEALRAQILAGPTTGLGRDTARVLVHLFRAEAREQRSVDAMVKTLAMERNVLQYHLDRLQNAGLVDVLIGNGLVYWTLTVEGRKHVMEGGLN